MDRRAEQRSVEPASFDVIRQVASTIGVFVQDIGRERLEGVLAGIINLDKFGPALVEEFGPKHSRTLAQAISDIRVPEGDGKESKSAKSAKRWGKRALSRIKDHGWEDPEPDYGYGRVGYGSSIDFWGSRW